MNTPSMLKCAGAIIALTVVSACGNAAAVAPSAAAVTTTYVGRTLFVNGAPVTAARLNPPPAYTQLVPDKTAATDYEYIIGYYATYAGIFDYPKGTSEIGEISGAGGQGCTNALYGYGKGIIWNPGRTNDKINEYAVPKKLIKSLTLDYTYTSSCAMNSSGDLAIGILLGNDYSRGGQVVIYKNAEGKPKVYQTPLKKEYFNGYDAKGDLFADGFLTTYQFGLVELPAGKSKFITIKTTNTPSFPGSVQWDGTYVTVFDQSTSLLYQYKVSGTRATLKHTVTISGAGDCAQTWIVPGLLYCGDAGTDGGEVYKYPAGGSPTAILSGNFDSPLGVTAATQ